MDIRGRKMRKPPACVQCRKRKIGCDRVKPICGNCNKAGKSDCFYPDVPGRYVPSSSSYTSTKQHVDRPVGNLINNYNSIPHSKEATSILQHNPELASLEQIREYNTRLQLLSQDQTRASPSPMENAQFIPRAHTSFENKPVSSANESARHLNWVQGPAIFDQMTAPYTQEEVMLKEMNFLRKRLLELQEITGKKVNGVNLSFDASLSRANDYSSSGKANNKKRKIDEKATDGISEADLKFSEILNEFKDLDPRFLDYTKVFSIFGSQNLPLSDFEDTPNSIYTNHFLTLRDNFSYNFRKTFASVIKNNYETELTLWKRKKIGHASLNLLNGPVEGKTTQIKFPSRETTQAMITRFTYIAKDINLLIPILKTRELYSSIDQSFGREPVFDPATLNIGQLITFGQISFSLLFTYESLASSVLIILKDEQLEGFNQLIKYLPQLLKNINAIKAELDKRKGSLQTVETLKFTALYKAYQTITSLSSSGSGKVNDFVDFDEDVHLALHLGINDEQKDENNMLIWNFIYKNYCWRHSFKGEVPIMMIGDKLNTAPIVDTLLSSDYSFLTYQMETLQYLQSKDQILSLEKVIRIKDIFKSKFDAQTKRCVLSGSTAIAVNNVIDTIIYRKGMLYMTYYILLQYEVLKDTEKFIEIYKELLQMIQDTIFYIFSNLANKTIAGYEFMYMNKLFITLRLICTLLVALQQRSTFAIVDKEKENKEKLLRESGAQADLFTTILRKLLMLLEDYTKNCKVNNSIVASTITMIQTSIAFISLGDDPVEGEDVSDDIKTKKATLVEESKKTLQSAANCFENFGVDDFIKFNITLKNISESLIVNDFYTKRDRFVSSNPETLGINVETFDMIYDAME
ncbi:similar to Saccharomyces cerevisiae YHR056C RSC30 Component of the RSC chromatin remodeling complex [Maudiozyma barnettii]|uniref:Similar to Saccharomyces cerevisiae YHR056C RSC30 Component of the RSC chromatin remodeling complex n=1 Tax=Maudiozyma barnettii TaxID=61262 RepID=A0A8H2VGF3_9SACH|nr:uncharacterized protein KABA2_05S05302 [Kazachstania barnettii]CAB4254965.1 similar to Saccharomyces cerevisiae YHR056C RSC30 Component of the RSC chromatin remodeling complex [Kazachstania barnettii]CAD1783236.1 similar to Saccharomyces cerevisiae YHR056C RSC30 Component of the RSC chromatin remodeling complex [Kazachstania barnettii]